jgi:hypothetical protein
MLLYYQREHILWQHIGQFWSGDAQIDVAAVRKDNWIDLGECKWGKVRSLEAMAMELEEKTKKYPNNADYSIGKHLFLRNSSIQRIENFKIHSLADLFE